jgi:hypothetical protein
MTTVIIALLVPMNDRVLNWARISPFSHDFSVVFVAKGVVQPQLLRTLAM